MYAGDRLQAGRIGKKNRLVNYEFGSKESLQELPRGNFGKCFELRQHNRSTDGPVFFLRGNLFQP